MLIENCDGAATKTIHIHAETLNGTFTFMAMDLFVCPDVIDVNKHRYTLDGVYDNYTGFIFAFPTKILDN